MKKRFIALMLIMLALFGTSYSSAQVCPTGTITASTSSTPRNCGSDGKITVNFSNSSDVSLLLTKSGQIVSQVNPPNSPYTFSNLLPGSDYQVKILCKYDNSIVLKTLSVTVGDNYVPISDANIAISNVCTNFTKGGTITINNITGGTAPYQYKIVLSNDPAFSDATGTYSSTNSATLSDFGTYQIRVKDACGNYKTFTKSLTATLNPVRFYWSPKEICGSTQVQGNNWYWTDNITNGASSLNNYLPNGIKLQIRDTNANGTILFDGTYTGGSFNYTPNASHTYYVTTTNACGLTASYTHTLTSPDNNPEFLNFTPIAKTTGCGPTEKMGISMNFGNQSFWKYPVAITVKDSSGTTVKTSTSNGGIWSTTNLDPGTYTVTVADSCVPSKSVTKTVTNPQLDGTPSLSLYQTLKWRCGDLTPLTQTGTSQALVQINGYLPNRSGATVTITSGPSQVGTAATYIDNQYWGWSNLLPGTYNVSFKSCGNTTYTGSFTVPDNAKLNQSLKSTAVSFCTSGGNITSNVVYNGSYDYVIELINNANNNIVSSNTSGNFSNIPAGSYTTRIHVKPFCGSQYDYYVLGSSVTITNSSTGPIISSNSIGVVCEDSSGNPLTTGSAYLELSGVAPFTLNYKISGTSTWTTISNASASTIVTGLTANTVYDLQLKDSCGGTYNSQGVIKTMGALNSENNLQPCYNQPYDLSVKYYAGASYEWLNPQGNVVSNTRIYSIPSYTASYDGLYVCKITWSNCVTRYVKIYLNGSLCGGPVKNVCFKDAGTSEPILSTMHGITSLGRAGVEKNNWPMVRKGAHTVLESKTKGFVINRLSTSQKNQLTPAEAMIVYDTDLNCLSIYINGAWKCFNTATCPDN